MWCILATHQLLRSSLILQRSRISHTRNWAIEWLESGICSILHPPAAYSLFVVQVSSETDELRNNNSIAMTRPLFAAESFLAVTKWWASSSALETVNANSSPHPLHTKEDPLTKNINDTKINQQNDIGSTFSGHQSSFHIERQAILASTTSQVLKDLASKGIPSEGELDGFPRSALKKLGDSGDLEQVEQNDVADFGAALQNFKQCWEHDVEHAFSSRKIITCFWLSPTSCDACRSECESSCDKWGWLECDSSCDECGNSSCDKCDWLVHRSKYKKVVSGRQWL